MSFVKNAYYIFKYTTKIIKIIYNLFCPITLCYDISKYLKYIQWRTINEKIFALLGIVSVSASLLIGCGLGQRNAKNREKRDLTLGCVRFNYDEVNNSVAIKDLESM